MFCLIIALLSFGVIGFSVFGFPDEVLELVPSLSWDDWPPVSRGVSSPLEELEEDDEEDEEEEASSSLTPTVTVGTLEIVWHGICLPSLCK